jgi:hypothetical protein
MLGGTVSCMPDEYYIRILRLCNAARLTWRLVNVCEHFYRNVRIADRLENQNFSYIKKITKARQVSVAAVSITMSLDTYDDLSCQGNRPMFVLLSSGQTERNYLKQVNINFIMTFSLMIVSSCIIIMLYLGL